MDWNPPGSEPLRLFEQVFNMKAPLGTMDRFQPSLSGKSGADKTELGVFNCLRPYRRSGKVEPSFAGRRGPDSVAAADILLSRGRRQGSDRNSAYDSGADWPSKTPNSRQWFPFYPGGSGASRGVFTLLTDRLALGTNKSRVRQA